MEPTKQDQWQRLVGHIIGYQTTWIVDIGLKGGLFRAIAAAGPEGIGDEELARSCAFFPRYVGLWCRAAYAYELLDWDARTGYRLAPHMEALLLDTGDPQFIGGRIQFYAALYEDFRAFPAYLHSGETWPRSAHDPWLLEALKNLSKPDAGVVTASILPQVPEALGRLERGGALLDIGCGAGFALTHYAARFPCARVVGLELDEPSVELARCEVAAAGLADRVEVRHGDATRLDEEAAYDVVTLNIALHETGGPPEYRAVLDGVRRALKPGGVVVVLELPYPDSPDAYRGSPVYRLLAGVQLHEALVGCGMITQGELRALMADCGFSNARVVQQPLPTRFVMIGEK